jgi:hypothetical protein
MRLMVVPYTYYTRSGRAVMEPLMRLFMEDTRVRAGKYWLQIVERGIAYFGGSVALLDILIDIDPLFITEHLFNLLYKATVWRCRNVFEKLLAMVQKHSKVHYSDQEKVREILGDVLTRNFELHRLKKLMVCDDVRVIVDRRRQLSHWTGDLKPKLYQITIDYNIGIANLNYIMEVAGFLSTYYTRGAPMVIEFILQPCLIELCYKIHPKLKHLLHPLKLRKEEGGRKRKRARKSQ